MYVKVSDLEKFVRELKADKIKFADLIFLEASEDDGELIPASISVNGLESLEFTVDYGEIEEVSENVIRENLSRG